MYFLQNFIPVFINIIIFPLTYEYGYQKIWGTANLNDIRTLFNILIVPIFLLVVNIVSIVKTRKKISTCILTSMAIICLNSLITYIDWGLSTGLFLNPDSETVMVAIYVNTVFPILIILFGMLVFHIVMKLKTRRQK